VGKCTIDGLAITALAVGEQTIDEMAQANVTVENFVYNKWISHS
jgi:hypothetical protein